METSNQQWCYAGLVDIHSHIFFYLFFILGLKIFFYFDVKSSLFFCSNISATQIKFCFTLNISANKFLQAIYIDDFGIMYPASDPRKGGRAAGI